jgi:hypothetical protein
MVPTLSERSDHVATAGQKVRFSVMLKIVGARHFPSATGDEQEFTVRTRFRRKHSFTFKPHPSFHERAAGIIPVRAVVLVEEFRLKEVEPVQGLLALLGERVQVLQQSPGQFLRLKTQ